MEIESLLLSPISLLLILLAGLIPFFGSILRKEGGDASTEKSLKRLPPCPKKLPILGNLHQVSPLDKSIPKLVARHGPILFLQLGSVPTLVVSSTVAARDILKDNDLAFSGRPETRAARKITYGYKDITFAPYGKFWREARKIVLLELLSLKKIQSFQAVRNEEVQLILDSIARSCRRHETININDLSLLLSSSVMSRVTFGKKFHGQDGSKSKFESLLHETQVLLGEFCVSDYLPWMSWMNKLNGFDKRLDMILTQFDQIHQELIKDHTDSSRTKPDHDAFVDVLLRIKKDANQTIALSDEQVKGIYLDMFIAGSDTSASTIVWTMTELMRHPSAMRKAQEEIRQAARGKTRVDESDLPKLTYLKNVIKESLRLHPPVPFLVPRKALEECSIGGYDIPRGTTVFVNAAALGRDPERWKRPDDFLPERFSDNEVDYRGRHYEFLPFGAGRRICPGINFAMLLVEFALANLIGSFDWELPQGMRGEDVDMEAQHGLTVFKKTPLCLVATPMTFIPR